MKFQINDILNITNGKLLFNNDTSGNFSISTDTRSISSNDIFLPLVGLNFDGHNFINAALNKGCTGYFFDKNNKDKANLFSKSAKFAIEVDNTLEAYLKLANFIRHEINPVVIAVTGSSGKTTTKEMVFSVLSQQYRTHKSKLNHNNEVGLCQTLFAMPEDTEFLVVETGMRGAGEIELLSKYAEPDIAVITNIGTAHIGRLGSIENIAKAKCEITRYLNKNGILISRNDDLIKDTLLWDGKIIYYDLISPEKTEIIAANQDGSRFIYKNNTYQLNVPGEYNIINALAAIEIGLLKGITPLVINKGLMRYSPIENRGQIINLKNNIKLINDSYNANPDSMKASINAVIGSYHDVNIILVLGNMGELGDHEDFLHREIGMFLNDKPVSEIITVGEKAQLIAESIENKKIKINSFSKNDEVVKYIIENILENSVILLKASRSMVFENIASQLEKDMPFVK